jgi:hypothetical protein
MLDTPELGPCLIAPFVALAVGVLLYGAVLLIGGVFTRRAQNKTKNWNRLALAVLIFSLPFTCMASVVLGVGVLEPAPWFSPGAEDIIGTWRLTDRTSELYEERYNVPQEFHELVFYSDGAFVVENIPPLWGLCSEDTPSLSGSGEWHLDSLVGNYGPETVVSLDFKTIDCSVTDIKIEGTEATMYFVGYLPPYTLRILNGASIRVSFQRTEGND